MQYATIALLVFFSARILTLAARGIEGLIRNQGIIRLIIGCTLKEEVEAIARGGKLKEVVDRSLSNFPLIPENIEEAEALELLSWMVAQGYLEVKLALPCSPKRQPIPAQGFGRELSRTVFFRKKLELLKTKLETDWRLMAV